MFTIRQATGDDAIRISRLMILVATTQIAADFSLEGQRQLLSGMSPEAVTKALQEGFRYYLGFNDGRLCGVIGMRGYSHIYHLFVAPDMQRRGLARQLWNTADRAARSEIAVSVYTVYSSRRAEGFYNRLGFRRTGPDVSRNGVTAVPMCLKINNLDTR